MRTLSGTIGQCPVTHTRIVRRPTKHHLVVSTARDRDADGRVVDVGINRALNHHPNIIRRIRPVSQRRRVAVKAIGVRIETARVVGEAIDLVFVLGGV